MTIKNKTELDIRCIGCDRTPDEIDEYIDQAIDDETTPEQYVIDYEATFNPSNGHFACTVCYIAMGMPSSPQGWKAP
jgi:hypothetical protein